MSAPQSAQPPALSLKPHHSEATELPEVHENEWYRQDFGGGYRVKELPLHTKRPLRMIIVGAGAAGLQIAYKAERELENVSFEIYEKNDDVGGTWYENRYPGCTCDIPSHSYQWSFWRNPGWSDFYSSSSEIWQYMKDFAVSHDLEKHVRFKHTVQEAKWVPSDGVWEVKIQDPQGKAFTKRAEFLASCHGGLNQYRFPDIPGVDKFRGKLMHSAHWDDTYDLTNKTVAVIGGGSSAVQIIPSIQPCVKKLVPFLRSPVWVTSGFGAKFAGPGGANFSYSKEEKKNFDQADILDKYGREVEAELNKRFTLMHLNSADQKMSRAYVREDMKQKLGHDPRLTQHLIPDFALGCRRMTPGSGYLQSLLKENVEVVTDSAVEFTVDGVIDASGKEYKVDAIICATGFETGSPSYNIIGQNGRSLSEKWQLNARGYLSCMVDGFPNLFYFIGPNGPASHGSILPVIEWITRYMFKVISHAQRTSIKSISPKREAVEEAYVHTHELLKRTAWSASCSSWFKGGKKHGPVTAIWPGSRLHWFESLKEPRYEDFDIEYSGNRFSYLGNGYTFTELHEETNAVWYFDVLKEELQSGKSAFDVAPIQH
ncbi:FAD/NAD(P)-binding domain-containing protein [Aspergillus insuetus]